jgi:Cytochrome c7 and related cytochrome c/Class III cytochrome C family
MKTADMKPAYLALCAAAVIGLAAAQSTKQSPADAPAQPLPFSHKVHAGTMKLACKMCHPNPDPGETMSIVAPPACMQCHSAIKADSPVIQRLAQYAKDGRQPPWVRVYQIPSWVDFSHRSHLAKGNTCQECHGQVAERDQLYRETDLSMGGCMECHKAKKASLDCGYCHEVKN